MKKGGGSEDTRGEGGLNLDAKYRLDGIQKKRKKKRKRNHVGAGEYGKTFVKQRVTARCSDNGRGDANMSSEGLEKWGGGLKSFLS